MSEASFNLELVSIIMPAYNAASYIAESIESVMAQTYPHWELLVVDDGSTDATQEIIRAYQQQDARVKYLYQDNARQGRARNNGIAHSSGNYIAFLDSDDLWMPEKLAVQLLSLKENHADLVFSDTYVFDSDLGLTAKSKKMNAPHGVFIGESSVNIFLTGNRIPTLTVLCKRHVLKKVGGFTENRLVQNAEDYHLWLKLLLEGYRLVGTDDILAAYRRHSASVSDSDGQNLKQAVEARVDLATTYPEKKDIIIASIRPTVILALEQLGKSSDVAFFASIDRYLQITGNSRYRLLFVGFDKLRARRLAYKAIYFVFNYL